MTVDPSRRGQDPKYVMTNLCQGGVLLWSRSLHVVIGSYNIINVVKKNMMSPYYKYMYNLFVFCSLTMSRQYSKNSFGIGISFCML